MKQPYNSKIKQQPAQQQQQPAQQQQQPTQQQQQPTQQQQQRCSISTTQSPTTMS